jgi:hypothetical protein
MLETEEDLLDEIGDTDYVFILTADGELKSLILPEGDDDELPDAILEILNLLELDITAPNRTLH